MSARAQRGTLLPIDLPSRDEGASLWNFLSDKRVHTFILKGRTLYFTVCKSRDPPLPQSGSVPTEGSIKSSSLHAAMWSRTRKCWHWAGPLTLRLISSSSEEHSLGCLSPFGARGILAANQLWHQAASAVSHQPSSVLDCSWPGPALTCLCALRWKDTRVTPGEKLKASSDSAQSAWAALYISLAGVLVLHFFPRLSNKVQKQAVCL